MNRIGRRPTREGEQQAPLRWLRHRERLLRRQHVSRREAARCVHTHLKQRPARQTHSTATAQMIFHKLALHRERLLRLRHVSRRVVAARCVHTHLTQRPARQVRGRVMEQVILRKLAHMPERRRPTFRRAQTCRHHSVLTAKDRRPNGTARPRPTGRSVWRKRPARRWAWRSSLYCSRRRREVDDGTGAIAAAAARH